MGTARQMALDALCAWQERVRMPGTSDDYSRPQAGWDGSAARRLTVVACAGHPRLVLITAKGADSGPSPHKRQSSGSRYRYVMSGVGPASTPFLGFNTARRGWRLCGRRDGDAPASPIFRHRGAGAPVGQLRVEHRLAKRALVKNVAHFYRLCPPLLKFRVSTGGRARSPGVSTVFRDPDALGAIQPEQHGATSVPATCRSSGRCATIGGAAGCGRAAALHENFGL
jgi:hypothetical protein